MRGASSVLWYIYGYVYDGLLVFYPYRKLIDDVCKQVAVKPGEVVADLGCGTGNVLARLSNKDIELIGVDVSRSMLSVARRKLKGCVAQVTLEQHDTLTFLKKRASSSIDLVVLCNAVYTLHASNRKVLWRELKRVLGPGGKIVIANPDQVGSESLIDHHRRHESVWKLIHPKLIMVWMVDKLIDIFIRRGSFDLQTLEQLEEEVGLIGEVTYLGRTYGDAKDGIDVLLTVAKRT